MFIECPTNEAGTTRVCTAGRPLANPSNLRKRLEMDKAFLTRELRVRKTYASQPDAEKSQYSAASDETSQAEVGPLHTLLSEPLRKQPRSRFVALKAPAKRVLIAARCCGLLSVETTQRLVNKFGLWRA
jgi:hypothetical protein